MEHILEVKHVNVYYTEKKSLLKNRTEKIISNRLQIVQYYFDNVVIWSYN